MRREELWLQSQNKKLTCEVCDVRFEVGVLFHLVRGLDVSQGKIGLFGGAGVGKTVQSIASPCDFGV